MNEAAEVRRKAGLTVEQAAKLSGYKPNTIRYAEKPRSPTSYQCAIRLSALYQCSPYVFLRQGSRSRKSGK